MLERLKIHINTNFSYLQKSKCLIACSGGLDSVVLANLCHKLDLDFALAHCNFHLRDDESDADEAFVIDLGDQLNAEVFVEHFDTKTYADNEKQSIQLAARELRYNWFYELAEALQYDFILTAHHADDNLETILLNLSRGTGITGLIGIPEENDKVIRPLLPFSRQELEDYAKANSLHWREDSSNATDKYSRNYLRHNVIPHLKSLNPDILQQINATISNLKDTADIVDESLNAVAKRAIVDIDEHAIHFKISEFKKVNNAKAYLFEMFKAYGFTAWDDIVALLDAQSGKQVLSDTHRLIKDRKHLILTELDNEVDKDYVIHDLNDSIGTPLGTLCFLETDDAEKSKPNSICIDKDTIQFPLILRKWQKGDVFYPSGMKGKKKLSKYFKDEKLSLPEKERALLLCSEDKIVWVVGRRADERFKVTKTTKHILKISLN